MQAEQSLNMNLSQHLAMTMKMQQAIQILQLSAQDLRAEIEKEYLENPALEMDYGDGAPCDVSNGESILHADNLSRMADYLGEDTKQPKYFTDDENRTFEAAAPVSLTLEDALLEQVNFAFSETEQKERAIATFMVGSLNASGYLTLSLDEIAHVMKVSSAKVREVLDLVQTFEPAGVAACNLSECLRIQAKQQDIYEGLVAAVIDKYLDKVAGAQIREIAAAEGCKPQEVQMAVDLVRTLNPRPGNAYSAEETAFIVPDVVVKKGVKGYQISLNDTYIPQLHIASAYAHAEGFDAETKKYINQRLSAAAWLINSIEQRRQTIRRVVEEIVRVQQDFIEGGSLHPLTMKEVADAIGVHESTVSRAVANKYVELPGSVQALRRFFTANLAKSSDGEDFIASQAKQAIEEMIKGENPQKPLSDQKLCALLKERKMDISRRTVMKYREQLGYPSSVKRKRY